MQEGVRAPSAPVLHRYSFSMIPQNVQLFTNMMLNFFSLHVLLLQIDKIR